MRPASPAAAQAGVRRRRTWWLVGVLAAAALLAVPLAVVAPGSHEPSGAIGWFVLVALGFALAELRVVHVRLGRDAHAISFSEVPLVVGLVFLPPGPLLLARLVGALPAFAFPRRTLPVKITFNLVWQVLETAVALLVWYAVLGDGDPFGPRGWAAAGLAVLVTSLLGSALVSLAISVNGNRRPRLREAASVGLVIDLVNAGVAIVVVLLLATGPEATWLVGVIVLLLAFAYRSHERLRQRSEALERLNHFTARVGGQGDVDSVLASVLSEVRDAVHAETVALQLGDSSGTPVTWSLRDGEVVRAAEAERALVSAVEPLADEPVLEPRDRRSRRRRSPVLRASGAKDLVAVPLPGDGPRLGVLVAANRVGDLETFTHLDVLELQALANHAAVALENSRRAELLRTQVAQRAYQALHDDLTGLPNRRGFQEASRTAGGGSVLMLDLDRFKEINDALGHHTGDQLLRLAAERIRLVSPAGAVVARLGGDEFAALLPGADEASAWAVAADLRRALARPFPLDGMSVAVDVSIGIAVGEGACVSSAVLRGADVAMYAAKSARSGIEVYRPQLDRHNPERLTMLADLRDAMASRTLSVAYQPKVHLADGRVCGMEALARWDHPRFGPVAPEDFVTLAEYSGLISELTQFVLTEALTQCQAWRRAGASLPVAVNLSPRSLLEPTFLDDLTRALSRVEVSAGDLTLEITESSLMTEPDAAIELMHRIRGLGVRLSIDDMGTGYSSLAYLQRLPVDEVKIDRSFLSVLPDPAADAVITAIIDLGHRLNRTVVAEGVEDAGMWDRLNRLSCDSAQGYWISPPMPAADVRGWLSTWGDRHPATLGALR